jgi:2-dehydropantoate 2-reductase
MFRPTKERRMSKKIVIMGVGAAGSYIGAFLTREGYDVTLIDMWGEHVEAMRANGLRASGSQGDFTVPVKADHLTDAMQLNQKFDIGFIAVKSYDTEWAAHFLKRLIKPDGVVVVSQNCMNDRLVASIVGYDRTVGCIMSGITVALWEPGHVNRGGQPGRDRGHDVFRVGEFHGRITPRVEEIVEMLSCIDGAKPTTNLWGERWSKLTTNSSGNPVGAMMGEGGQTVAANADARRIQINICKESCQVALAQNYVVENIRGITAETYANADNGEVYEELDAKFMPSGGSGPDWKSSMGQDVAKGRHTEVEFMNGYISEQGRIAGVPTPINDAIVQVVSEIDAGTRQPSPDNVQVVLKLAGMI